MCTVATVKEQCARLPYGNALGIEGIGPSFLYPYMFVADPAQQTHIFRHFICVAGFQQIPSFVLPAPLRIY